MIFFALIVEQLQADMERDTMWEQDLLENEDPGHDYEVYGDEVSDLILCMYVCMYVCVCLFFYLSDSYVMSPCPFHIYTERQRDAWVHHAYIHTYIHTFLCDESLSIAHIHTCIHT
jgi:hypothetical protein